MLAEFAVVSIVLFLMLSTILSFGMILLQANVAQQAADVCAREIAKYPLPFDAQLPLSLVDQANPGTAVDISQIYREDFLYVDAESLGGQSFTDYMTSAPLVNRLLAPAMIFDTSLQAYRFPGAVVLHDDVKTVLVPMVNVSTNEITWHLPVEEVLFSGNVSQCNATPQLDLDGFVAGAIVIRVNIPVQSSVMTGFQKPVDQGGDGSPIEADDTAVIANLPAGYSFVVEDNAGFDEDGNQIHGGKYGLGRQFAFAKNVRPYREVVSGQAIYRREALLPR